MPSVEEERHSISHMYTFKTGMEKLNKIPIRNLTRQILSKWIQFYGICLHDMALPSFHHGCCKSSISKILSAVWVTKILFVLIIRELPNAHKASSYFSFYLPITEHFLCLPIIYCGKKLQSSRGLFFSTYIPKVFKFL